MKYAGLQRTGMGVLALMLSVFFTAAAAAPERWLLVENGTVIDVESGKAAPGQSITIRGSKIVAVGAEPTGVPGDARRIDASGKFIIPGLWDMHVHVLWLEEAVDPFFTLSVANGVTGVRDMGGDPALLKAVVEGKLGREGWTPSLYVAGPMLVGKSAGPPNMSLVITSPQEADGAVAMLRRWGADFAKVQSSLSPETFRAVAGAARKHMLGLAGHLPEGVTIDEAAAAGMRTIEHMVAERGGYCAPDDRATCREKFRKLKAHGIFQTPTLVLWNRHAYMDDPGWEYADEFQLAPPPVRTIWAKERNKRRAETGARRTERRKAFDHDKWMAAELVKAGVPMLAGTDAGTPYVLPGMSMHEELQRLVTAGLSPARALRMATLDAARFMGFRDSGRIAPGMTADLVILRRNPLERIRYTGSIEAVVRFGYLHDRAALDAELEGMRGQ